MRLAVEIQIDQISGGRPAVPNQVAHQGIYYVRINFHGYGIRYYSKRFRYFVSGVLHSTTTAVILLLMIKRFKFIGIPVLDQVRALLVLHRKTGV